MQLAILFPALIKVPLDAFRKHSSPLFLSATLHRDVVVSVRSVAGGMGEILHTKVVDAR